MVDPRTVDIGPLQGRLLPEPPPAANRLYPWLLVASTALAGIFCVLYLTKPVIVTAGPVASGVSGMLAASSPVPKVSPGAKTETSLMPDAVALPGELSRPVQANPRAMSSANANAFEETNLRVQHVLGAQGPAGEDLGRVILDVPVLYRSRALRWTPQEIARARQVMAGIANYQEKSRALREEGSQLLAAWNELIEASIPVESLRADSPTLPANQGSGRMPGENLDTSHSIKIDR